MLLSFAPRLSRRALGGVSAAALTATLTGCGTTAKRNPRGPLRRVTYLTGFGAAGREAHAWVAVAKGFFAEAGLDVTVQLGAPGENNTKLLLAGQAQFAGVDGSGEFIRHSGGADVGTTIVAAVQQQTLLSIVAFKDSGITVPKDLEGKKLGGGVGAAPRTLFPGYAKLAGFDPATVRWTEATPQQLPGLLIAGQVNAVGLFVVAAPGVQAAAKGRETVVLPYSAYFTDLFGTVLVAPTSLVKSDPDLVRRFTSALMKGLKYTVDNAKESAQILKQAQPTQDLAVAAAEIEAMRPYALPNRDQQVGVVDPARAARSIAVLQGLDLLQSGLTPDKCVDFTMLGDAPKAG